MNKKLLLMFVISFSIITYLLLFSKPPTYLAPIPVVQEHHNHLNSTIKVILYETVGSGTIIYYNGETKNAYIISAGHLWTTSKDNKCQIEINGEIIEAELLLRGEGMENDCSLLKVKLDKAPKYCVIAPYDYKLSKKEYYSMGCDNNSEPMSYNVEYLGSARLIKRENIVFITQFNSPQPGRSGGGLFDEEYLLGVCSGTSRRDGTGYGYFTPLKTIHHVLGKNGYGWLLRAK